MMARVRCGHCGGMLTVPGSKLNSVGRRVPLRQEGRWYIHAVTKCLRPVHAKHNGQSRPITSFPREFPVHVLPRERGKEADVWGAFPDDEKKRVLHIVFGSDGKRVEAGICSLEDVPAGITANRVEIRPLPPKEAKAKEVPVAELTE